MTDTVVIGMGNPLMSDEGIGIRVLEQLRTRALPDDVEVMDLGTYGMAVLHAIAGRRRAIFIDCACMGEAPGTLRRFTPDEVSSTKLQTRLSLHEGDLLHTLSLSRSLGECPDDVVILGIEPEGMEPGDALSPVLARNLQAYTDVLVAEVEVPHA